MGIEDTILSTTFAPRSIICLFKCLIVHLLNKREGEPLSGKWAIAIAILEKGNVVQQWTVLMVSCTSKYPSLSRTLVCFEHTHTRQISTPILDEPRRPNKTKDGHGNPERQRVEKVEKSFVCS